MRIIQLNEESRKNILADLLKRDPNNYGSYEDTVKTIVNDVKEGGDAAVFEYTKRFDGADITAANVRVTDAEIQEALALVEPQLLTVKIGRAHV